MYSVLVLGYVPGTNIQISFQAWLVMAGVVGAITTAVFLAHKHRRGLAARWQRLPLHASQLHTRLQTVR